MTASEEEKIEFANNLFQQGKFTEAKKAYSRILTKEPENFEVIVRLGRIALFSNHFTEAEKWLTIAIELKPEEKAPRALLAEVFYRQDEFQKAAPLLRFIGEEDMATRLESFKDVSPNQIEGKSKFTKLKFVMTDPLPIIQVRVNDSKTVNFFIDTGAAETIIDTEFAEEIGAEIFGSIMGTFAGGKKAPVQFGKVKSLTLGDFTVKNLPVSIMPVRHFSDRVFGGTQVEGIIGTTLFYHFITTMDYLNGEVIFRRKTEQNLLQIEQEIEMQKMIVVPFWLAGDHYMVARGKINNSKPLLFFVDTGFAGGGFICPESTIKEANIELQRDKKSTGIGGGGETQAIPFIVDELTFGDAIEKNIRSVCTPHSPIEHSLGFHIGGIISHGFFRNYALTFDFTKMRLFLRKRE